MNTTMPIHWGAATAEERGPVMPVVSHPEYGNAIGVRGGAYGFATELAKIRHAINPNEHGAVDPEHVPKLEYTKPVFRVQPNASWHDPAAIVSFDPWGALSMKDFGVDPSINGNGKMRPTIAITRSRFKHLGIVEAMNSGRLHADDNILRKDGTYQVTDVNIDPVWFIPGVAKRLGISIEEFRRLLYEKTHMFPELLSRPDLDLLLPPLDGPNVHIFGDPAKLGQAGTEIGARSHDYCRDGDNGARRCTCAESKQYAIEELIQIGQAGGVGILVMNPEEGRSLGSVVKHLVYNMREQQPGGDSAQQYFECTKAIAGGDDARMHWAKADPFNWLNARSINHWFSESPHKRQLMEKFGVTIAHQYQLPADRIPEEARVEMDAKRDAGYVGDTR